MTALWIRLKHNWFRNGLAVLQVAIAIAALSAVFVDVLPALTESPAGDGASTFTVRFGARTSVSTMWTGAFLPGDVEYLLEHAESVDAASVMDSRFRGVVRVGEERYMLRGFSHVHPSFQRLMDLEMVAGAFFTEEDVASPPRVAVIADELARFLYGDGSAALGETINVRPDMESSILQGFAPAEARAEALGDPGNDVTVIGIFRHAEAGGAGFSSAEQTVMFMPSVAPGPGEPRRYASEIWVKAKPGMDEAAEDEIRRLLTQRLEERGDADREMDGVRLEVMVEPMLGGSAFRQAQIVNALIFGSLGLAALIVSAIAMFTTTLANLAQRTRYIGLGRALGATRGRVVREVVAESALLAGIGGVVGVALAFPLRATVLSPLLGVLSSGGVRPSDVLLMGMTGVALSVVVGGVAGLYPAWTVAKLAPSEAWREGQL